MAPVSNKRKSDSTPPVAEDLLALIFRNIKDYAIILLDPEGRVESWNPSAHNLLGHTADDVVGKHISSFFTPEDVKRGVPARELERARERGEVDEEGWRVRKDGSRFRSTGSLTALRERDGTLRGFVEILRNSTEREEARQAAQEAQRAAEAANRSKDEFLATLSHELRTPLNSIVGWAHMMKQAVLDKATSERALDTIIRNAQAQGRLISDMLDMSRILAGQLRLDIQEVELIPVIESALETLRPAASAKEVTLDSQLDPRAEPILGDPLRMQQVVWNLLANAVRFAPQGGLVTARLERAGRHVRIAVRDNGPGMAPELVPVVFDRYSRGAKPLGAGLGLGLAIVRHIVELHGGAVEVHSEQGKGAEFVVTVPWWNPKDVQPATAAEEEKTRIDLAGMRVLLVEDEADTRDLLTVMLTNFGAEVHAVSTGDEALAALTTSPPDVMVSDIRMETIDGYALIRDVRALPSERGGTVPAVALTALTRPEDRRRALEAGYQVHVPKPVTPAKLVAVLGFLLRQRKPTPTGRQSRLTQQ
jgi:PAS domain S-box-containing protein